MSASSSEPASRPAVAGPWSSMRVVVCDDDPGVRSVITELVEQHSGQVIAETDGSASAIALIERFDPDVVIVDLALAHGSGMDIVEFLADRPATTRVIVFTAFDGVIDTDRWSVRVVRKPDFELLERYLGHSAVQAAEQDRRRPTRDVPAAGDRSDAGTDGADEFYRLLADAHTDDTLLRLSLDGLVAADTTAAVRATLRVQDRLIQRGQSLIALLIGGGDAAPEAVCRRLAATVPDVAERTVSLPAGDDPIASFMRLTGDH